VYSRVIFGAFAFVALFVLWRLYTMTGSGTRAGDRGRIIALGLAWGGAAGNLVDRFRSPLGVVDFIDIGYGSVRFWTFNVADSAVTVGAILLAWSLSQEDRQQRHAEAAAVIVPEAAFAPARRQTAVRPARTWHRKSRASTRSSCRATAVGHRQTWQGHATTTPPGRLLAPAPRQPRGSPPSSPHAVRHVDRG